MSFENIPTLTAGGTTVESRVGDFKVASFGLIRIFVPLIDINAAGGTLSTENLFRDFNVLSITNQQNFDGDGEDISNNTEDLELANRSSAFSHTYRCYHPSLSAPPFCSGPGLGPQQMRRV